MVLRSLVERTYGGGEAEIRRTGHKRYTIKLYPVIAVNCELACGRQHELQNNYKQKQQVIELLLFGGSFPHDHCWAGGVLCMCLCFMTHGGAFPYVSQHCSLLLQLRIKKKGFSISMEIKMYLFSDF